MQDRFKFRYVFEKDFGGKTGICYKMPVFNLDDAVRSVFENKIIEYTNFGYKLIAKNQCTGLKDKNGTLIYEGDICKYKFEEIGEQKAIIYFNKKLCSFLAKPLNDFQYTRINDCEVIGNIYENKEILNEI